MKQKIIGPYSFREILKAEVKKENETWIVQTECGQYKIFAHEVEPVIRLEGNGERVAIAYNANHFVVAVFTKVIYFARLSNFKAREDVTTEDDGK